MEEKIKNNTNTGRGNTFNQVEKKILNYVLNLALLVIFVIVGATGFILFPGLLHLFGITTGSIPRVDIIWLHNWIGFTIALLALVHVFLHWQWIAAMTKRIVRRGTKKKVKQRSFVNYLVAIGLGISFLFVVVTGIIKYSGFQTYFSINPRALPMYELSLIHDWMGVLAVGLMILHFVLHIKLLVSMTKHIKQLVKADRNVLGKGAVVTGIILSTLLTIAMYSGGNPLDQEGVQLFGTSDDAISIQGVGQFAFDPNEISTTRGDIFNLGHFSVFDILVHVHTAGLIDLQYHFDEQLNTYVIDAINDQENWWYEAYYDGGWPENNVFRMDHYPYKEKMTISLYQTSASHLESVYSVFREEVNRKTLNQGAVIIPEVIIRAPSESLLFSDVEVTAHNLRGDVFQPGVITAIDVILSLGDHDKLTYDLQWYASIGSAEVVRDYWVERINNDQAFGRCGFVYEAGSRQYSGFRGNHIHIPSDTRVITSPEYEEWFWICL